MARPKKRTTLTNEWIKDFSKPSGVLAMGIPSGIYRSFNLMAKSGRFVPQRLDLAQEVIQALLHRLSRYDKTKEKTGTKQLAVWIYLIAVREIYWDTRPSYFQMTRKHIQPYHHELFGSLLQKIYSGHTDRANHLHETLVLQRNWLDCFLHKQGYEKQKNEAHDRLNWLNKHREQILEGLRLFPCYCSYPQIIEMPTIKALSTYRDGPREAFISAVLSKVHKTTESVVRKLCKPSSRKQAYEGPRYEFAIDSDGATRATLTDKCPSFWPWFD